MELELEWEWDGLDEDYLAGTGGNGGEDFSWVRLDGVRVSSDGESDGNENGMGFGGSKDSSTVCGDGGEDCTCNDKKKGTGVDVVTSDVELFGEDDGSRGGSVWSGNDSVTRMV